MYHYSDWLDARIRNIAGSNILNILLIPLDTGFDSQKNKYLIIEQKMIPVIYPNRRNTKDPIAIALLFSSFNKALLYKERYKVGRTFGWQDTYRKLAISYDRLEEIRLGSRNLAYAVINFRVTFNSS